MVVIALADRASRDIVSTLEYLLAQARAGQLRGVSVCSKNSGGREEIYFAGDYQRSLAEASNSAVRMAWRSAQMQDERDAGESGFY